MKYLKKVVRLMLVVLLLPVAAAAGMGQWAFDDTEENALSSWLKLL